MPLDRDSLALRYQRVRARTLELAAHFSPEEQLVQVFADASPTKWHLGHTTWFFERFVLATHDGSYGAVDPDFEYVFNSYYEAIGPRQPRHTRGLVVRPSLADVIGYRERVDAAMQHFLTTAENRAWSAAAPALELGTHHEEQHQELLLTDAKPLRGAATTARLAAMPASIDRAEGNPTIPLHWQAETGGLVEIGWDATCGFAFDNESPRHRVWLEPFEIATRLVTVGEYLTFMDDGGYATPAHWLSDGWVSVQSQGWRAPMYWRHTDSGWCEQRLDGLYKLDLEAPVSHVSYYEADAYARWAGARLPSEAEWETAAARQAIAGNFLDSGMLRPMPADGSPQFHGDVWQWTASAYAPYPRFQPFAGAFGEYNGKFMSSQMVLRGGSCFTPAEHMRSTYRNFFPPSARWQMSGLRLARWS